MAEQVNPTTGKKSWRAGKDCKASQHYPAGFGEAIRKLYEMHHDDVVKHCQQVEAESAPLSFRDVVFATCMDDWDDAELAVVWKLLE
jgi:hypothetical protein